MAVINPNVRPKTKDSKVRGIVKTKPAQTRGQNESAIRMSQCGTEVPFDKRMRPGQPGRIGDMSTISSRHCDTTQRRRFTSKLLGYVLAEVLVGDLLVGSVFLNGRQGLVDGLEQFRLALADYRCGVIGIRLLRDDLYRRVGLVLLEIEEG